MSGWAWVLVIALVVWTVFELTAADEDEKPKRELYDRP